MANALDPADAIDFSETADGWFKISPYGTFRGKVPGRPQTVALENAKAMEGELNSVVGILGRAFRGVPIYHGHPDVDPEIWPDDRRIGKITKLEARANGLWGLAEWNSIGQANKVEGWWIYPSPRWDAPAGKTSFAPDRLISIGLTNTPRIVESEPEATDEEVLAKLDSFTAAATEKDAMAPGLENAKTALVDEIAKKDELGIRNEAESKRKAQTLVQRDEDSKSKGCGGLTDLQKAIQRLTQRTVKFIRWLKNHLDATRSWPEALARLAKIYATS